MPRVEKIVAEVVAFSQESSKKVALDESQKVKPVESQEVEQEERSFRYS